MILYNIKTVRYCEILAVNLHQRVTVYIILLSLQYVNHVTFFLSLNFWLLILTTINTEGDLCCRYSQFTEPHINLSRHSLPLQMLRPHGCSPMLFLSSCCFLSYRWRWSVWMWKIFNLTAPVWNLLSIRHWGEKITSAIVSMWRCCDFLNYNQRKGVI